MKHESERYIELDPGAPTPVLVWERLEQIGRADHSAAGEQQRHAEGRFLSVCPADRTGRSPHPGCKGRLAYQPANVTQDRPSIGSDPRRNGRER